MKNEKQKEIHSKGKDRGDEQVRFSTATESLNYSREIFELRERKEIFTRRIQSKKEIKMRRERTRTKPFYEQELPFLMFCVVIFCGCMFPSVRKKTLFFLRLSCLLLPFVDLCSD